MPVAAHRQPVTLLHRLLAGSCALLVLALSIFAASPVAHAWLHSAASGCTAHHHAPAGDAGTDDPGCAVVLFAAGAALPAAPVALIPPTAVPLGVSPVSSAEPFLVRPRYLRQPERGPPALV